MTSRVILDQLSDTLGLGRRNWLTLADVLRREASSWWFSYLLRIASRTLGFVSLWRCCHLRCIMRHPQWSWNWHFPVLLALCFDRQAMRTWWFLELYVFFDCRSGTFLSLLLKLCGGVLLHFPSLFYPPDLIFDVFFPIDLRLLSRWIGGNVIFFFCRFWWVPSTMITVSLHLIDILIQ